MKVLGVGRKREKWKETIRGAKSLSSDGELSFSVSRTLTPLQYSKGRIWV